MHSTNTYFSLLVLYMCSIAFYNFFGQAVTKSLTGENLVIYFRRNAKLLLTEVLAVVIGVVAA